MTPGGEPPLPIVAGGAAAWQAVESLLSTVGKLLPQPAEVQPGDEIGGTLGPSAAEKPNSAEAVAALLCSVARAYEHAARARLADAGEALARFDGIPQAINMLEILRKGHSETAFSAALAWLLDSSASHGLGDAFVRLFLAGAGITHRGRIMTATEPLQSRALVEVPLPTSVLLPARMSSPSRADADDTDSAGRARIDVLLALDGLLVPIEVKVDADETSLMVPDLRPDPETGSRTLPQGAAYVAGLYRLARAPSPAAPGADGPTPPRHPWDDVVITSFAGQGIRALERDNPSLRIRGVLLHLPRACDVNVRERRARERSFSPRHMNWLDVDAMLFRVLQAQRPRDDVRFTVASFRTAVVAHIAKKEGAKQPDLDIPTLVSNLRVLHAHPGIVSKDPVRNYAVVRDLADSLHRQDACTDGRTSPYRDYAHEFED